LHFGIRSTAGDGSGGINAVCMRRFSVNDFL
jgi:hypothetical protein